LNALYRGCKSLLAFNLWHNVLSRERFNFEIKQARITIPDKCLAVLQHWPVGVIGQICYVLATIIKIFGYIL